jgi:hypothetical protein
MSPALYKPVEKLVQNNAPNFPFAKNPVKNFIIEYTKRKNFVPGPSAYSPDKADKIITIGARRSYK